MKKKFYGALLLGSVLLAGGMVSCSDYDDDIAALQSQTNDLSSQITKLNEALDATKGEASAAKTAAEEAKAAADSAKAAAEEAKAAAAEAKADAIEAAIDACKELMSGTASQEDLDKVKSTIEGIQKDLSTINGTVNDIVKWQTAVDVQIAALEKFKETTTTDITTLQSKIDGLVTELNNVKTSIPTSADIEAMVKDACKEINTELETIGTALNTLQGVIANRLTSTVFVPTDYIDGIPAITFKTLKYTPQTFNKLHASGSDNPAGTGSTTVDAGKELLVSNKETIAQYRLNPTGVNTSDIEMPSYVSMQATNQTRAGQPIDDPVGVVKDQTLNIEDGILKLRVEKTTTENLNLASTENGKVEHFYQVALKTPIAKANLMEGENEAYVYSEYVRVAEKTVSPFIEKSVKSASGVTVDNAEESWQIAEGTDQHYKDSTFIYQSKAGEYISWKAPYDQPLDLTKLVNVCEFDAATDKVGDIHQTMENYKSYGLALRYRLATGEYITKGGPEGNSNETDQQKFATIADAAKGIMTSKVYTINGVSATAVGREPVVAIELRDTVRNNLVSLRYMKIKWVKETEVKTIDLTPLADTLYVCDNYEGIVGTQQMNEEIYNKAQEGGMTKKEFHAVYTKLEKVKGDGTITSIINSEAGVDSYNLKWTLSHTEIGAIWTALNKTYTITFKYSDPEGAYPDLIFTLSRKIVMPEIGIWGHNGIYWQGQNEYQIFNINPIIMKNEEAQATCNIHADLLNGFIKGNDKPTDAADALYFINTVKGNTKEAYTYEAAGVTFQFDASKLNTGKYVYYINGQKATATVIDNKLYLNDILAATIYNVDNTTEDVNGKAYNIVLKETDPTADPYDGTEPTEAAKALIGKNVPVKLVADLCNDNKNVKTVKEYDAYIITPLTVKATVDDVFTDAVINGSRIGVAGINEYTDWNGNKVSEAIGAGTTANELYKYYEVEDLEWPLNADGTIKATTNLKNVNGNLVPTSGYENGTLPSNVKITYDKTTNELVYWNQSGTPVNNDYVIYITPTVSYKWQTVPAKIAVTVKKAGGVPTNN